MIFTLKPVADRKSLEHVEPDRRGRFVLGGGEIYSSEILASHYFTYDEQGRIPDFELSVDGACTIVWWALTLTDGRSAEGTISRTLSVYKGVTLIISFTDCWIE